MSRPISPLKREGGVLTTFHRPLRVVFSYTARAGVGARVGVDLGVGVGFGVCVGLSVDVGVCVHHVAGSIVIGK